MKRQQAVRVYFEHNQKGREILRRLMLFDPTKSFRDNSNKLGISVSLCRELIFNYHLPHRSKKEAYKNMWESRNAERDSRIIKEWDKNMTLSGNAKKFDLCVATTRKIAIRHKLSYCHTHETTPFKIKRLKRIVGLIHKGITPSEIGRFMGITRERVSQLADQARQHGIR